MRRGVRNMPVCVNCRKLLPPNFMDKKSEEDYLCHFCIENKDSIEYTDDDGSTKSYTKTECEKEYLIFCRQVSEELKVKERFMKDPGGELRKAMKKG